jgi:glutamate-5-semialdehyde dehydrogenase
MNVVEAAKAAKDATASLLGAGEDARRRALEAMALSLEARMSEIIKFNQQDLAAADAAKLPAALIDRLRLDERTIRGMARGCRAIAAQDAVVGMVVEEHVRGDKLIIQRQRVPLGVVGMVFESRPNVVVDGAALAVKSGNAILLKGGKEAQHSNRILGEIVRTAIAPHLPAASVQLLETREEVMELLKLNQYVDLMVPRGGEGLIRFVKEHATMPVVAHDRGLCHMYLHPDAEGARELVINAKVQRPSACNALETLLWHRDFSTDELTAVLGELAATGVEIHGCPATRTLLPGITAAQDSDFDTEWLGPQLSVKRVDSAQEAIAHIQKHGSHHTEAVITQDPQIIESFLNQIDASCLAINASTRFNDGGELGLGAELGISTSKLHAYGPMGAKEMTTTRFVVRGTGHVRS